MGVVLEKGLNYMADGVGQQSSLYLGAYEGTGGTTLVGTPVSVTFGDASGGVASMTGGNRTIVDMPSDTTITIVRLQDTIASVSSALGVAEDDVVAVFTDGGDLVIKTFTITVT